MPGFFVNNEAIGEREIIISGDDAHHIARSLRMAVGDGITVSDGAGGEYKCRLSRIRDDECIAEILSHGDASGEPPAKISLYMAYPKSDKLELIIQKAVELGAFEIFPFESSRCIKRPKAEKIEKQTARLSRIAEEAAKQCGRGILPLVHEPISFAEMLKLASGAECGLFCYEGDGTLSLKRALEEHKGAKSFSVIVGSEGGFSPDEAEAAIAAGLLAVNLGPRILRCETAPMYTLSSLSYFFELYSRIFSVLQGVF